MSRRILVWLFIVLSPSFLYASTIYQLVDLPAEQNGCSLSGTIEVDIPVPGPGEETLVYATQLESFQVIIDCPDVTMSTDYPNYEYPEGSPLQIAYPQQPLVATSTELKFRPEVNSLELTGSDAIGFGRQQQIGWYSGPSQYTYFARQVNGDEFKWDSLVIGNPVIGNNPVQTVEPAMRGLLGCGLLGLLLFRRF